MPKEVAVTQPDLSSRPLRTICERMMVGPPHVLFPAWTTDQIGRWFAAPSTGLMKPEVNVPFFFETHFGGCAVRNPRFPGLGNTADTNLISWPKAIRRVQDGFPGARIVVPGHGPVSDATLLSYTVDLF